MTHLRSVMIAVVAGVSFLLVSGSAWAGSTSGRSSERVLTGEMVVINTAGNQFRLVTHGGQFTAPPGVSLQPLDRKPVSVEIGADGRVTSIREIPVVVEPIEHGFEVVSGYVLLRDPARRTFTLYGDDRMYVAPAGVDITRYADRMAEIRVSADGTVTRIEPMTRFGDAPQRSAVRECRFADATLASGASMCRQGTTVRCVDGTWINTGQPCR